ncbi:hypothetical protein KP509_06G072500 [Ceratopteris richardii]|uniref:Uncharacterized protein n=1 Tax=Ceratopteris richardii TaxID=49495 RepID=A0A8T2UHP5_CERRI|nr:hypothetical protein KP509_06G072500 [Ceratopteris richardii]
MHIWNILIVAAGSCYVVQSLQRSLSSNGRSSAGNNDDDNQNSCSRSLETPIGRWLHKPSRRCFKDSRHGSKHNVMKQPIQSECIVCDRCSSSIYSDAKEDVQSHFSTMKPYCNYSDAVDSHALLCSEVSSRFHPILSNFNTVRPQKHHAFFLSMQSLRNPCSPTQDSLKELPCFMSSLYSRDVIRSSQIHANSFKGIAKFKRDRSPFEIYENAVSLNIANKSWCRDQLEDAVCSLCSKEEKPCAWKISRSKDTMLYEENGSNSNDLTEIERCLVYFCPNLSVSGQNKSCAQRCHQFKQESAIDYANVGVPCERQLHQHEEMHGNDKNRLDRFLFNFGVGIGIMFAILSDKSVKANQIGHLEGSLYTSKCLDQDEAHGRMNLNRTILGNNKNITLTEQNDISNARLIQDVLSSVEQIKGSLMRDLEPTSDTDNHWAQRMAKVEAELEIELKRMENILDHEAATSSRDTNESCIKTLKVNRVGR